MAEKKKLTDKDIEQIEVMSGLRIPIEHMATILGFACRETLERRIKKSEAARDAQLRGRSKASVKVRGTAYRRATEDQIIEEETEVLIEERTKYPDGRVVVTKIPKKLKKIRKTGPNIEALKFWCETQEGFKRTEKLILDREAAVDAEFEDLTDDQIIERTRKAEKALRR